MDGKSWEKLREWLPNSYEWKMIEARKERRKGREKGRVVEIRSARSILRFYFD